MALTAQKPAPAVPAAKPVSSQASQEFTSLKQQLNVESWEMSPSSWDKIQIAYTTQGSEQQARSFVAAIEVKGQEIL